MSALSHVLEKLARFVQNVNYMQPWTSGVDLPKPPQPPSSNSTSASASNDPFDWGFKKINMPNSAPKYHITANTRLNWNAVDFDKYKKDLTNHINNVLSVATTYSPSSPSDSIRPSQPQSNLWTSLRDTMPQYLNDNFWNKVKSATTFGSLLNVFRNAHPTIARYADTHFDYKDPSGYHALTPGLLANTMLEFTARNMMPANLNYGHNRTSNLFFDPNFMNKWLSVDYNHSGAPVLSRYHFNTVYGNPFGMASNTVFHQPAKSNRIIYG